jgi:beta-glucosidase/6-phospho-beta-glucosidase/beta-galactosidase
MRILAAIALIGFATATAATAAAQVNTGNAELNNALEMVRSVSRLDRKTVIAAHLTMTPDESAQFWPLYDEYAAELKEVDDRLVQLVVDYARNFENLSDEMARAMLDDYLDIESDRLDVRKKYVRRFDDVLAPKKLARFVQVENKLNVVAELYLADEIPLVR